MARIAFQISDHNLTFFAKGRLWSVASDHQNFANIREGLLTSMLEPDQLVELADIKVAIQNASPEGLLRFVGDALQYRNERLANEVTMRFFLARVSRNRKTGPIPVATISSDSCPQDCPLMRAGCYAEHGPLRVHWRRVDSAGLGFDAFLRRIRRLPRGQIWRYVQAGDLPPAADSASPGMRSI